jgi:hypothetical protein
LTNDWRRSIGLQLAAIQKAAGHLTPENRHCLEILVESRRLKNPFQRLRYFWRGGFCRQSRLDQAAACLAALLGKV